MTLLEPILDGFAEMRSHPGRTLLQAMGVVLGVASIVGCLTLVAATSRQSLQFFAQFGGLQKILVRTNMPTGANLSGKEKAATGLTVSDAMMLQEEGKHFGTVDPVAGEDLLVRSGDDARVRWVQGVTPNFALVYAIHPVKGRFLTGRDVRMAERVVVLGDTSARRLFGGEEPVGRVVDIGGQAFTVVGVLGRKEYRFGSGGGGNALEWMNEFILVPLTAITLRLRGDPDGRLGWLNVMALSPDEADAAAEEVERLLLRAHGGVRDFRVHNRRDRVRAMQEQMLAFNVTFLVSAAVSLLVGGVVITNILLASFKTRVREVGVRKAVGASGLAIFVQFLGESVVVTGLAGVAGLGLGWVFTKAIASLTRASAPITLGTVGVALGVAVATGLVFGFYPALRAARLPPVEALRYE